MLYDSYIVINLPDIWSPFYIRDDGMIIPYEFNWIKELGTSMIDEVLITSGGVNLATYSG